jgi:hypothetical protein
MSGLYLEQLLQIISNSSVFLQFGTLHSLAANASVE